MTVEARPGGGGPGGEEPSLLRLNYLESQLWDRVDVPEPTAPGGRPAPGPDILTPDGAPPHLRLQLYGETRAGPGRIHPVTSGDDTPFHLLLPADSDELGDGLPDEPEGDPSGNPWPAEVFDAGEYDLPVTANRLVLQYMRLYLGQGKPQIALWLARSGRYAEMILGQLRAYDMPQDLIHVVMIESGFSPRAVSPSQAGGLWQFMRTTGQAYGLRCDAWVDERFDPVRASDAAIRHLRDLYDLYGSWELALAAYNGGIGRVGRAIARYNTNDFWTLARYNYLPRETVHYVAKITAATIIGRHRQQFGLGAVALDEPLPGREVRPPPGLSLGAIASRLRVREQTLVQLNPWLLRRTIPTSGPLPRLVVPSTAAAAAAMGDRLPDMKVGDGPPFLPHVVKLGETLGELSRTYGVSGALLAELNQVADDEELLPGQQLLIPMGGGRTGKATSRGGRRLVVVPPMSFSYPDRDKIFFPIPRRGMDLQAIAATFAVEIDDILLWNDIDRNANLWPGMVLRLFVPKGAPLPKARILSPQQVDEVVVESRRFGEEMKRLSPTWKIRRRSRHFTYHRVGAGESLVQIAAKHGVAPSVVAQANRLRGDQLEEGQVLRIPAPGGRGTAPRPAGHKP